MSLGKINSFRDLFDKIKQLKKEGKSDADIGKYLKELALADFPKYFGRYESSSGRLWFEMYQHSDTVEGGSIVLRKGEKGKAKLEEDLILSPEQALTRFRQLATKGYWPVFSAKTQAEMDEANAKLVRGNEDILGLFINDKAFIRIDCYGDNYSIQHGYAGVMSDAEHEQTEEQARAVLSEALENGYHREGEKPKTKEPDTPYAITVDLNLD